MSKAEHDLDRLARDSLHFRRRVVELAPGEELDLDTGQWREALLLLESGEVELECVAGERRRFTAGAVLCVPPRVRSLCNCGGELAVLITISRRARKRSG